jgi:protein-S-isoprenylcysteine O-methyltransferase Ste14
MSRSLSLLVVFCVYVGVVFGWRTLQQYQRTGSTGFHGVSGAVGSASWWGGVLFIVGLVLLPLGTVLDASGAWDAWQLDNSRTADVVTAVGAALCALGAVGTIVAQQAMGASWRIGVQQGEQTQLVHGGVFAVVRNPIFTTMVLSSLGYALLVPHVLTVLGVVVIVVAVELQVRVVEEPYLRATHGEAWLGYARRVGRFVPGLGRVR